MARRRTVGACVQVGTRRNYLEHGHITDDEAVLSFMRALEDHKKKCEREGKYMEARTAAKRLHGAPRPGSLGEDPTWGGETEAPR
jgi:hypothetical protein